MSTRSRRQFGDPVPSHVEREIRRSSVGVLIPDSKSEIPGFVRLKFPNLRTQAAIAAGIDEADRLEILTPLSEEEVLASELSHNAIAGKDDPNILAQLFLLIQSLEFKAYTGLEDGVFKCDDETLKKVGIRRPAYEELTLMFSGAGRATVVYPVAMPTQNIRFAMSSCGYQPTC